MFVPRNNIRRTSLKLETLLSVFDCYIGGIVNCASEISGAHKGNNAEKAVSKCSVLSMMN
jgi:hypothetical protein